MKSRKKTAIDNPVLHFGSDVAQDLISKIDKALALGFAGQEQYEQSIHEAMLLMMQNKWQPAKVRERLVLNKKVPIHKVNALMRRYVLILDTEGRRTKFLSGEKTFWEASAITSHVKVSKDRYKALIHCLTTVCERQDIPDAVMFEDFAAHRAQYRANHGWI